MRKDAVKKLTYLSKYVPDQYKTQQMVKKEKKLKSITNC